MARKSLTTAGVVSRRSVLKQGAAAAVGGGVATLLVGGGASAEQTSTPSRSPSRSGDRRSFRAAVRHGTGLTVQELTLLPISGRQVLVRTQATQACYTIVRDALGSDTAARAAILGHGGVGIVEAVGPLVKRVQVGDRVIVTVTKQCGTCYQCLHGRPDMCQLTDPAVPVAEMRDGTPVFQAGPGGFAELMVPFEDYCIPIVSTVASDQLAFLSCVGASGLSASMVYVPIEPGSDVVVMGTGPIGLSAIQGARLQGAARIIAVEPIKYRRDLALKMGATLVLDPNVERDNLVEKIRTLCRGQFERNFAGGRAGRGRGPDYTIEASGADRYPPKAEVGPDPTGITALQQAWEFTAAGGHIINVGTGHTGTVSFPAGRWGNHGRTQHAGPGTGVAVLRDLPRFVRLIETGRFDAKSLATANYPLDRARDAFQAAADRTTVSAQVVFD